LASVRPKGPNRPRPKGPNSPRPKGPNSPRPKGPNSPRPTSLSVGVTSAVRQAHGAPPPSPPRQAGWDSQRPTSHRAYILKKVLILLVSVSLSSAAFAASFCVQRVSSSFCVACFLATIISDIRSSDSGLRFITSRKGSRSTTRNSQSSWATTVAVRRSPVMRDISPK